VKCCEFMTCGRELSGVKAKELRHCATSSKTMFEETEGSGDARLACWVAAGAVCDGRSQGPCIEEMSDCSSYRLYDYVCNQERQRLENSSNLLRKLHTEKLESTI
jgi:hypothetical protein